MAQRLQQISSHFEPPTRPSLVHGARDPPPLWERTLKDLLEQQAATYGDREAVVCAWTAARLSYAQLNRRSRIVAKALLGLGVRPGDTVAIMAGNCQQYVEVFFATARVGAILVLVNNTYTRAEFEDAVHHTEPKVLFISHTIGTKSNDDIIDLFRHRTTRTAFPYLQHVLLLKETPRINPECMKYYEDALARFQVSDYELAQVDGRFAPDTVCNLQFTSGTTGRPKAAMLTHYGLLNNGRYVGDNMELTAADRLCSPPPIFHIFGLVLGMLACLTHGSCFVMPSEAFDAPAVLETVARERCTALHGDAQGHIVPIGQRGELCVAGYGLQKGYWKDRRTTDAVMVRDAQGTLWMHTGDEAVLDDDGYCHITGRIKDVIIRGGENIFPVEIENRLAQHPAIHAAVVVGIPDARYGEEVGAFLEQRANTQRPSEDEVRERLARQKVPRYVFWCETFPVTANGKIRKNVVKAWGESLAGGVESIRVEHITVFPTCTIRWIPS
ncbi:hypothetical protein VTN02DRAFT_5419 [Thermoascus thermophilus]